HPPATHGQTRGNRPLGGLPVRERLLQRSHPRAGRGAASVKRNREGRAPARPSSSWCSTFPGGSTLPTRAEPRPGVRQDAAFHRRHGLIPGGASTSSSEAPRAAPPSSWCSTFPGGLTFPGGDAPRGSTFSCPLLPVDPQPQLVAPLVLTLLIRAADVIPLGHQAQRRPAVEQVAQTQFGIHQIIHIAVVGNDGFRIVYQLETLAPQITAVIPVQTQTVGAAVRTIPGIDADVLEAGRGLEAAQ